jgi:hypothetical protein
MKVLEKRNTRASESPRPVTLMGVTLREAVILREARYEGWHEESPGNSVMSVKTQVFWKHK